MITLLRSTEATCRRDIKRFARRRGDFLQPLVFFLIVNTILAIGYGADPTLFRQLTPAAAWAAVVLALTINFSALFSYDFDDGTLEQLLLSPAPLSFLIGGKILAHWLATALPLIFVATSLAFVAGVDGKTLEAMLLGLVLGTPILTIIGAIASALTVGLHGSGMLIAAIALPLNIPILIFGTGLTHNASLGLPIAAEVYFLGGLLVLAITLGVIACTAAVRTRILS